MVTSKMEPRGELRVNRMTTAVKQPDNAFQRQNTMSPTSLKTPSKPLPPILPQNGDGSREDQASTALLQHTKSEVEEAMKQLRTEVSKSVYTGNDGCCRLRMQKL